MKKISFTLLAFIAIFSATAQHRSVFDSLPLAPDSYWNGSNLSGGFQISEAYFTNNYDTTYQYWSGFAYSDIPVNTDTITTGASDYLYQYSIADTMDLFGGKNFGLCYTGNNDAVIRLKGFAPGHPVFGMYVTNTAYDYLSMKYGDNFAKKFGGVTGMDSDWFRLTVTGWYQGNPIADSVNFYLADFRSPDPAQHYILNTWAFVNLLPLGNVDSLTFILSSDDTAGGFGMNTPAYFALNDFLTTDGASYYGPVAENDSFAFVYMDTLTGNPDTLVANLVANDTLSSFLYEYISLISAPQIIGATAYLNASDSLVYIPAAGITGVDTLYYSLCDETGLCDTAQILINVQSPLPSDTGVGIIEVSMPNLHLFPNPATNHISVSYTSAIESVSLMDMTGREVMQIDLGSSSANLNIESLTSGVYTVIIRTAEGTAARRLVKE